MRILIGLALLVALGAALTAGGFALFHAFRGRRFPALVWTVLAVVIFTVQCSAAFALKPVDFSASRSTSTPLPSQNPAPNTPAAPATPDSCRHLRTSTATELAVSDFGRIFADPGSCHVFVSSPASNSIVVLDYSGNVVKTIADEYGATAMVANGSVLYVALNGTGSIDEIDLHSLTRIKTLTSGLVKPADLAIAGGRLWTTSGNCSQWTVKLVGIDPATGDAKQYDPDRNTNLSYCAAFATASPASARLLAWDSGLEPANLTVLDVSSGAPVTAITQREEILGNLGDAVVTAGGKIVTASGAPYEFDQWRLTDLQQDGVVYPGSPYPVAVATAGGRIAAGVGSVAGETAAVRVFSLDKPAAIASFLPATDQNHQLYRRGLAMSPDGTVVFAVTGSFDPRQATVTFNVLPIP